MSAGTVKIWDLRDHAGADRVALFESGRVYLEGDRKSEADVRSVAQPVIAVQGPRVGPAGAQSPVVFLPEPTRDPLMGGN